MKNCIIKLKECYGRLSKSEKIVADYILKNKLTASDLTISELSKKTNVSCSTINRLALNLGYDGYKEFIKSLYLNAHNDEKELNKHIYDVDIDDDFNLSIKEVASLVCSLNIEAITNTYKMLDMKTLNKVIKLIDKAQRVVIFALSGSIVVAKDMLFKLERLGIACQVSDNYHSLLANASTLKKNELAVFISYSGNTKEVIEAAKLAKETEATVVGITMVGNNQLSKLVDYSIQHSSVDRGIKTFSTRSRVVQENIVDMIFIGLVTKRKEQLNKYYSLFMSR
ncbi:MAG: MurR/RpiR family transcriptional regulator [Candidatus Onthovivens sp.]|nr:MurR/RpiR family transcriptional regulator [bacterium]MDD7616259.1 MurR/RpiR family transcriptional regulator [bacterium]MDY4158773.1 MurR/RpiR family transcriptional regulator [Candidatus Onthovivens sp.]